MTRGPRNFGATPNLNHEGYFVKPLNVPEELTRKSHWHQGLSVYDRLNYHHTLSSVRRYVHFKPLPGLIPGDALDVALDADYDQGIGLFPDPMDVILQGVTTGADERRRLRNIVELPKAFDAIGAAAEMAEAEAIAKRKTDFELGGHKSPMTKWQYPRNQYGRYDKHHMLYVTGLKERRNPNNVKLMNTSHHSPQTNAGYSRQDSDGNAYQY